MTAVDVFRATRLVGREDELAQMHRTLAAVRARHGRVLFIEGPIGVGKTRLGREFLLRAQGERALCLTGSAFAAEMDLPYGVFMTALDALFRGERHGRPALAPLASAFARVAPSLYAGRPHADSPEDVGLVRSRLCDAFVQFLRESDPDRSLVLFLDDLHWADSHSLTLLHFLGRHIDGVKALIIATYRREEAAANPAFHEAAASLHRIGCLDEIVLRPLSCAETQALVKQILHYEDDLSPAFLELLYQHTEGSPLFLEETLRALAAQGDIYLHGGRWLRRPVRSLQVPQTLRDALMLRLTGLSRSERHVLEATASIGFEADYGLLLRVCGIDQDALDVILADLCRRGLLLETAIEGLRYRFPYPVLHSVVYTSLTEAVRRRHHRAIATALRASAVAGTPHSWASLARHAARGGASGLWQQHIDQMVAAAEQAWQGGAFIDACQIYELVLPGAAVAGGNDAARRPEGWLRLGDVRAWRGDFPGAIAAWHSALSAGGPADRRALVNCRIGTLRWQMGEEATAVHHLQESLDVLTETGDPYAAGRPLLAMARILCDQCCWDDAERLAAKALTLAELSGARAVAAEAHAVLLLVRGMSGEPDGGGAAATAALEAAAAPEDLPCLWQISWLRALSADLHGETETALAHLDRCRQLADTLRSPVFQARTDALLGAALGHRGAWDDALAAFGRAIDGQRELGMWGELPRPLAEAAVIHQRRGNMAAARAYLEEAGAIVEERAIARAAAVVPVNLGMAALSLGAGRPREARTHAGRALDRLGGDRRGGPVAAAALAAIVDAEAGCGDLTDAQRSLLTFQSLTRRTGDLLSRALYWHSHAVLLRVSDDPVGAADALRRSAELWGALARPFEEGQSRLELGQIALGRGDPQAVPALTRARDLLERLAAEPSLKVLRRELNALGIVAARRPLPARTQDVTEREREMIALIAQRRGTDEIAERLVISPATVRTHIRNIFRKLGVSSRAELVIVAREQGILG